MTKVFNNTGTIGKECLVELSDHQGSPFGALYVGCTSGKIPSTGYPLFSLLGSLIVILDPRKTDHFLDLDFSPYFLVMVF